VTVLITGGAFSVPCIGQSPFFFLGVKPPLAPTSLVFIPLQSRRPLIPSRWYEGRLCLDALGKFPRFGAGCE
jgi:hypothetical protein